MGKYMEIYDECHVCHKWDDLIRWQVKQEVWSKEKDKVTIACVCSDCYNRLDALTIRGWNKTNALIRLMEMQNGKK